MDYTKDDSLRMKGIAIILLIFHHMCNNAYWFESFNMTSLLPQARIMDLAVLARVCVWIFAFVSAYGMATIFLKSDEQSTPGIFVAKRWLSLMLAWWFAYPVQVIATLLSGTNIVNQFNGNIIYAFLDFMGWSDFFHTPMITGANWYITFAQMIIVLTPLLCLFTKRFRSVSIIYAFFAVMILRDVFRSRYGGDYAYYIIVIVAGNYLATNDVFKKIHIRKPWRATFLFGLVFIAAMSARFFISKRASSFLKYTSGCMALATIALCFGVTLVMKRDVVFKFLGKYSANMYFVHIFIVRSVLLHRYVSYVPLLVLIAVAGSLLISILLEWIKKVVRYNCIFRYLSLCLDKRRHEI